jgi:hypothetical protein
MSFGVIKTWEDYYKEAGQSGTNTGAVTRDELKKIFSEQTKELEHAIEREQTPKPVHSVSGKTGNRKEDNIEVGNRRNVPVTGKESNLVVLHEPPAQKQSTSNVELLPKDAPLPAKQVLSQQAEEFVQNEHNDYGLVPSPNEVGFHYWHQKKAIAQILRKIQVEKKHGILVLAKTGEGKTFIVGGTLRRLEDVSFSREVMLSGMPRSMSITPYLYVTRASIVTQTERVLLNKYKMGIDKCETINIEMLRSKAGRLWLTEQMEVQQGKELYLWKWKPAINPCVIVWDECQALKNEDSTQAQIAAAYNDLPPMCDTYQLFVSATPFTRVCEAKCWAVSTRRNIEHLGFPKGTILNNKTWPAYAHVIAGGSPYDYNEAAVDRLMKDLDDYIVQVKGVRPQFDAINSTELIDFQSEEEEKFYRAAWDRYLEEKAKLDAIAAIEGKGATGINELVAFQKFRMCAELCRKEYLAKEMYDIVQNKKKAAVCALNFKGSIISVVKILCDKYKVPREQISLIWGGGQTELTQKQKNKKKILENADKLRAAGVDVDEMLRGLELDKIEDRIVEELDPSLRLGAQSKEERQVEIDRFQSGRSLYCLFTFRAGGVGLSLHHSDEQVKEKVRRKDSGYAVEEDIPNISVRPRETIVAPTYSAIELVQGLGRAPRLTSLSDTVQRLVFYRRSIERDVAAIVAAKLRCLKAVVRQRESWMDIVEKSDKKDELTKKHLEAVPNELADERALEESATDLPEESEE